MEKVVFTNGCFDIIHPGHIDLLNRARALGSKLIVGINSDESVKSIKGNDRPFLTQEERREVLLGLKSVDEVFYFDELTPENLIQQIKPDVLVKGGDWAESEIIGAEFVKEYGGEVFSLSLKDGFSSSKIVDKIRHQQQQQPSLDVSKTNMNSKEIAINSINQHFETFHKILDNDLENINKCADLLFETLKDKKKVLICGNGGSAADAQHIAAEFVGRFETERIGLPAIALTTDTSALTALANDYDFERIFARQVEALASDGDCLIAISTSGTSPNVLAAVMSARKKGCRILGMTGSKGKKLASLSDACLMIPSDRTCRIQEAHITIAHIWCEIIDDKISKDEID